MRRVTHQMVLAVQDQGMFRAERQGRERQIALYRGLFRGPTPSLRAEMAPPAVAHEPIRASPTRIRSLAARSIDPTDHKHRRSPLPVEYWPSSGPSTEHCGDVIHRHHFIDGILRKRRHAGGHVRVHHQTANPRALDIKVPLTLLALIE